MICQLCRYPVVRNFVEFDLWFYLFPSKRRLEALHNAQEAYAEANKEVEKLNEEVDRLKCTESTECTECTERLGEQAAQRLQAAREAAVQTRRIIQAWNKSRGTSTYGLFVSMVIVASVLNSLWIAPGGCTSSCSSDSWCCRTQHCRRGRPHSWRQWLPYN